MDYLGLGKRVKESREKNGMTQQQLAEKISFSIQHISNIENGATKLSVDCLVEIINALDISADSLLRDNYEKHREMYYDNIIELLEECTISELKKIEIMVKTLIKLLKDK